MDSRKKVEILFIFIGKLVKSIKIKDARIEKLRAENYRLKQDMEFYRDRPLH